MGIDIDAFLEDFDSSNDVKKEDSKIKETNDTNSKKIDLTFNKYMNDKFNKLEENVSQEDFNFLVKAYSEIKKFDKNLPSKLLELNKTSSVVLNSLGKKYTTTFLEGIKSNKNKYGNFIIQNLKQIETLISNNQIPKAINLYNKVTSNYQLFPKEFIIDKIELGKKLRTIEIRINEAFIVFWEKELKQIKSNLSNEISSLKQNLVPGKIETIESHLHKINTILDNSPSIFYNELIKERIQVSKIIILSEEFLKTQYLIEFKEKETQFNKLFERFHTYQIKKDVNSALITYDELLNLFERMPDAFIEKKIGIYDRINKSFESLNNLILTNSISQFMTTYSSSKILSQAREYIMHAKINTNFDKSNLLSIKNQLDEIPKELYLEKEELETEINELLNIRKTNENKNEKTHNLNIKVKTPTKISNIESNNISKDITKKKEEEETTNLNITVKPPDEKVITKP
ncbi:MAG: hypothetical protein HRU03_08880, partial [Nanoarchaeales archaeon]|nr:hypothetical protein [Nanoarchaeales archaeon]